MNSIRPAYVAQAFEKQAAGEFRSYIHILLSRNNG